MKRVKCLNGHFFDMDRFSDCPICGAGVTGAELVPVGKNTTDKDGYTIPLLGTAGEHSPIANPVVISTSTPKETLEKQESLYGSRKAFHGNVDELAPTESLPDDLQTLENTNDAEETHAVTDIGVSTKEQISTVHTSAAAEAPDIKDKTALPMTLAYYNFDEVKPPVGWLVCVKGVYAGRAFECKTGRNRIGRNGNMEICLLHDTSISEEIHALIIYEPKQRVFYLQAGTSEGLTYLNGNYLFDHSELHAFDKIELGKAEFLFLPLCGEKFTWDDYVKRD